MFYAIICVICVKHEYLRKNGQVRTAFCKSHRLKGMHDTLIAEATGPLQLRDRLKSDGTAATVYATDSAACGAVWARRYRDQPGGGRADDAGPQSAAAAGRGATQIIRSHYANNTQSLRK